MLPSPHTIWRVHLPWGGHFQFFSTLQAPLQPSPGKALPSSHSSMPPWLLMPSPHPGGDCALQPAVLVLLHTSDDPVVPPDERGPLMSMWGPPPLPPPLTPPWPEPPVPPFWMVGSLQARP